MSTPWVLVWMALACASASYTLTKTPAFNWIRRRLKPTGALMALWACPYCMSHWVAFLLTGMLRPMPFTGGWVDLPVCAFVVVMLSAMLVQALVVSAEIVTSLAVLRDKWEAETDALDK